MAREEKAEKVEKKPPVIQVIRGHQLTRGEQFLRRVLPACVVSAGLHLVLAVGVWVCSLFAPIAEAAQTGQQIDVAIEDKADAPDDKNLTETTASLDPDSGAVTIEDAKLDSATIQTTVTDPDPAGNPEGNLNFKIDSLLTTGTANPNALTPGADLLNPGNGMIGGGMNSLATVADSFKGRGTSTTRDKLAKTGGGNKESELGVANGLSWLSRVQKKEGNWVFDKGSEKDTIAATGLGLLPFLAAGQTHKAGADNKYRDVAAGAIAYLIKQQNTDGSFKNSGGTYSHGIATVALCEAFGMTNDKSLLLKPCQAAIDYIQKTQGPNGSWGYSPGTDGDTSIVGWQVQALHSAKLCKDLKVDPKALQKAMKFLDTVASGASKYKYGYNNAGSARPSLTAVGLLCRYYLNGWGPNHPAMRDGVEYLMKAHKPSNEAVYDMYYYYYATQVMHFHEGDAWHKEWNPAMRDFLIAKQVKDKNKPTVDGSFDPDGGQWIGPSCGRLGTTCFAILTLEVYYRHLPLYGRGTGAKTELESR